MSASTVNLHTADLLVILGYIIAIVTLGMAVSYTRRHETDIFLGGRSFGWTHVGLSIWGTNITPAFLISGVGVAYSTGMVTANFEWLAWVFLLLLAMVFTPFYSALKIDTIPQIIQRRFGETTYRAMTLYVLYTVIIMWLGGALLSGGLLFSQILNWNFNFSVIFLMAIAASFTIAGGMAAVVVTDAFQTILIIIIAGALALIGLQEVGGFTPLVEQTPADYWKLFKPNSDQAFPWAAVALGYPVQALWFWCTDQTIVQRMFSAKDLQNAQRGALFAAYLKVLPPFIFTFTGILCFVLFPDLSDTDLALMTMVDELLPVGAKGLIIAVLMAALISSVDSGLNAFSTVFTLDIYKNWLKGKQSCSPERLRRVGRIVTLWASILAVLWAIVLGGFAQNLFAILQGLVAFVAPPIAALMLLALFSKRVTAKSALWGFFICTVISQLIGYLTLSEETFGLSERWPHYLYSSFALFIMSIAVTMTLAKITRHAPGEKPMPSLTALYESNKAAGSGRLWLGWGILALIMLGIYAFFEGLAARSANAEAAALEGPWPATVSVYRGSTPTLDGAIAPGEYDDATLIEGVAGWTPQFSPVADPADLAVKVMIKHDGKDLYVAYDVTDNLIYGVDIPRWQPDENPDVHAFNKEGWPWFGDGVELLVNARYRWSQKDEEYSHGNGHNWQMVASTHKSVLHGFKQGGLMMGEPRRAPGVWETYERWIREGHMSAAVRLKSPDQGKGYVVEWRVNADPCLEVSPGKYWSPAMGKVKMGLNLAVGDIDNKEDGTGNFGNFHHENWWAGEKDKRIWLKQWGTMIVYPEFRDET